MELLDYEKRHIDYLKENAGECTLFLKHNNEFPISKSCKVVLIGNGARKTIKGGTGSGDVASRFFKTIEEAFIENGFEITSTKWLDEYDNFKKQSLKEYIKNCKKEAKKASIMPIIYSMGYFEAEKDYNIPIEYDGDICIYVLARNSGEGNDRKNIKGDVKLSNQEVKDINYLNGKFKKFMLVLNVGGVVDLTPVNEVSNILYLSQLGVVTGDILPLIILGKINPSGKLTTTWAPYENYPFNNEFGNQDDTYYKEGLYVGYRYFNTINKPLLYPFGYGLSYSKFDINVINVSINKLVVSIKTEVKNISNIAGKEVVQVYVTKPNDLLENPFVELIEYKKTNIIKKLEKEIIDIDIDFEKLYSYDENRAINVLLKGEYILRIGNSSVDLKPICKCILKDEVVIEKLENKCGKASFKDLHLDRVSEDLSMIPSYILDASNIKTKTVKYIKNEYVDENIAKLSNEKLAMLCLGHYDGGIASMVGESCKHVVGGAGETCLKVNEVNISLTMSDGPAGIRIKQSYGVNKKGIYDTSLDPMMEKMLYFLPAIAKPFVLPKKNKKGTIHYQFTTAIPIGTAIGQSFNDEFAFNCGNIISEEMEMFGVDLWLAPAINIHRNILCGRNFEYYSEDPYLTGKTAINVIKGIEKNKKLGTTIKHFACNNQEFNRNNNNSCLSERTLREIYLKAFKMCIVETNPKALMTSYNLINGIHTSESYELINDILRCEWNYDGLVMSDWIASGRSFCKKSFYPAPMAYKGIKAGNDLTMPGCAKDYKCIIKALKENIITREDLIISASRIYRAIKKQKEK